MADDYKVLKQELQVLQDRTERARVAAVETVVAQIREQVAEYDITPDQIFGTKRAKKPVAAPVVKYLNPKTGATWSGRGRAPAWIRESKNRSRYLVK